MRIYYFLAFAYVHKQLVLHCSIQPLFATVLFVVTHQCAFLVYVYVYLYICMCVCILQCIISLYIYIYVLLRN